MIKKALVTLTLSLFFLSSFSQELTQTVRGTVVDADSKSPLIGVQIILIDSNPSKGTETNDQGQFSLANIPIGRISLEFTSLGYRTQVIRDISVISGKETILNIAMTESIMVLDEVVVSAEKSKNRGEALNEMAVVSSRSISSKETNRFAGGFNDPVRILSNFAGVNNSQDGSADIIVRGNSPKYIQWRLEGVQISNPSHFGDPGGLGTGAPSALNNHILATSDFYTGAFAAEFGDVLSGVYDVQLRTGNNKKFEGMMGVGILGTDLTLEGPFKKDYAGSYLVNYRYSTVSVIDQIGLVDIGGIPTFQDGAFKVMLPTKNFGDFSLFGLSGYSTLDFDDVDPTIFITPGNNGLRQTIQEDFRKRAHLINTGINHTYSINKNSFIKTTLAYSNEGIRDNIFETHTQNGAIDYARENFRSKIRTSTYRGNVTYNNKLNARNSVQVGTKYALFNHQFDISHLKNNTSDRVALVHMDENIGILRNFISWKHRLNENITIVSGIHNMNVLFNNKSTLEPRIAANWMVSSSNSVSIGYGSHSTMESIHNYFAKVEQPDGSLAEPNRDLDLLKAHHMVLGYEKRFSKNLRAKVELYYQHLYNLPVENDPNSYYATINETIDFQYVDLVNEGTGRNYGAEITLERFFANNYYFMINATFFNSTYTALDGIERNTAFNTNYLSNFLVGREFYNLGKKNNQVLSINAKAFFGGGRRIIPLLRDNQGNLAVDPLSNNFYDYNRAYETSLDDIYSISLAVSYKWNKSKTTHEVFINLDNLTNNQVRLMEFYEPNESGNVGYRTTFGLFPNMMYRIYF
ncbi:MAG: TonB-dependent receptor [Cytophagaceae bacterium]